MLDYWHHALSWASNVDFWGFLKLAFVAYASYVLCANVVVDYNKLPCVGVSNWPFSYALATVRSAYDFRYQIAEAYDKVRSIVLLILDPFIPVKLTILQVSDSGSGLQDPRLRFRSPCAIANYKVEIHHESTNGGCGPP